VTKKGSGEISSNGEAAVMVRERLASPGGEMTIPVSPELAYGNQVSPPDIQLGVAMVYDILVVVVTSKKNFKDVNDH
jgi:hypothetical protein